MRFEEPSDSIFLTTRHQVEVLKVDVWRNSSHLLIDRLIGPRLLRGGLPKCVRSRTVQ
jgi:hypothetical protein